MKLNELGKFKIERTEDYENARKDDLDLSYYTMIRVRGSKPVPCFEVPSHLYKYSEHELGLYLKDHKNCWGKLGKLLGINVEISDEEAVFISPVKKFNEVSKIVRFVKSKARKTPLNGNERKNAADRLANYTKKIQNIGGQNRVKTSMNDSKGIILLDSFMEVKK